MNLRFVSLVALFTTCAPLAAETEVERLKARCAEQELQIRQLELKIAQLTDTVPADVAVLPARTSSKPSPSASGYTVKAGDHIPRIARMHGTTSAVINQLNDLTQDAIIHPGQILKVPSGTASIEKYAAPAAPASKRTHKIADGETYYRISLKHGVTVDALIAANPGVNYRALRTGQTIIVPVSGSEVTQAAPSAPSSTPSLGQTSSIPVSNNFSAVEAPRASEKPVKITQEITYLEFAKNYRTTTKRLDELNGLDLDPSTVLAQGSELYIPAQP